MANTAPSCIAELGARAKTIGDTFTDEFSEQDVYFVLLCRALGAGEITIGVKHGLPGTLAVVGEKAPIKDLRAMCQKMARERPLLSDLNSHDLDILGQCRNLGFGTIKCSVVAGRFGHLMTAERTLDTSKETWLK